MRVKSLGNSLIPLALPWQPDYYKMDSGTSITLVAEELPNCDQLAIAKVEDPLPGQTSCF